MLCIAVKLHNVSKNLYFEEILSSELQNASRALSCHDIIDIESNNWLVACAVSPINSNEHRFCLWGTPVAYNVVILSSQASLFLQIDPFYLFYFSHVLATIFKMMTMIAHVTSPFENN